MAKFYVEWMLVLGPITFLLLWFIWFRISRIWHKRRYKNKGYKNDRGRIGEENRRELIKKDERKSGRKKDKGDAGTAKPSTNTESSVAGSSQPKKRSTLPKGTSNQSGKDSGGFRGIFKTLGWKK